MRRQKFDGLEKFSFVNPGPDAVATICGVPRHKRYANLSALKVGRGRECAWCNARPIPKGKRRYCSDNCDASAFWYLNPQSPGARAFIFCKLQNCVCPDCGEDSAEEIETWIRKELERRARAAANPVKIYYHSDAPLTYYWIGASMGDRWHVDHIRAIADGGRGIGFENVQVLCAGCHARKTALEAGIRVLERKFLAGDDCGAALDLLRAGTPENLRRYIPARFVRGSRIV